ncbi:MAG: SH3 domain-containing protein [Candidatus Omnitrophota bacterium]
MRILFFMCSRNIWDRRHAILRIAEDAVSVCCRTGRRVLHRLLIATPKLQVVAGFVLIGMFAVEFSAYPSYTAKITRDKIYVRVDSTALSTALGYLDKDEEVRVVEERYEWCRIILPPRFLCYIASRFVQTIDAQTVEVTSSSVNLRNEPTLLSSVVGRVSQGARLSVVAKNDEWFKVAGYPYSYAWVNKGFLQKIDPLFEVEGVILSVINRSQCKANITLKAGDREYFLLIPAANFRKFLHRKVKVKGQKLKSNCEYIRVEKLSFVR